MNLTKSMPNDQSLPSTHDPQDYHHHLSSSSLYSRLVEACKFKNIDQLKLICNQLGLEAQQRSSNSITGLLNKRDKHQRTLFHYIAIIIRKQDQEPNPNGTEQQQQNTNDCEKEEEMRSIECLGYLTNHPLCDSKRLWFSRDLDGLTILHLAVISTNLPLVRHLLFEHPYASLRPSLLNILDNEQHSPLHWAVISQRLDCVQTLINSSGDITQTVHEGDLNDATPLHYATQTNQYPQLKRRLQNMLHKSSTYVAGQNNLREDIEEDKRSGSLESKRHLVKRDSIPSQPNADLEILKYLVRLPNINLECTDNDRRTPLLWAASSGNLEAMKILVSSGANINSFDSNDLSALHCSASHGFTDCLEFLLSSAKSKTNQQIQVDQLDRLRCTPLFYSVLSGQIDCIEILLENGAKADWQDARGRTAAHFAALKGHLGALKLLDSRGANLWLPNKQGDLPLHYAIKSGRKQVISWLLDHSPYERTVNAINNQGRAPIHLAVTKDNPDLVGYLINRGANLNQLVKVRAQSSKGVGSRKTSFGSTGDLATAGAQNQPRFRYETAYDMAKRLHRPDCMRLLAEHRALPASQVIQNRMNQNSEILGGARSIFDVQPAYGTSPIGLDTSSSSASGSPINPIQQNTPNRESEQFHPTKVRAPPTRAIPEKDRSVKQTPQPEIHHKRPYTRSQSEPSRQSGPVKGGISYNNDRINASIKCKLYDSRDEDSGQQSERKRPETNGPPQGQEIITNVNVYTSPCPHCMHHQRCNDCTIPEAIPGSAMELTTENSLSTSVKGERMRMTNISSSARNNENEHEAWKQRARFRDDPSPSSALPRLDYQSAPHIRGPMRSHHLPPSQNHEQNLPPIPSASERSDEQSDERSLSIVSSSSGSSSSCSTIDGSRVEASDSQPSDGHRRLTEKNSLSRCTPEEPLRFDRSPIRAKSPIEAKLREQTRSPVADYISSGRRLPQPNEIHRFGSIHSHHHNHHHPINYQMPNLDRIQPKVETRRSVSPASVQTDWDERERSLSRQTMTLRPVDETRYHQSPSRHRKYSDQMTTQVEKSVRRYWQESKLFEELQNLKRQQIRSGRANEALLVKRLIERFHKDTIDSQLLGLQMYRGPYSFESYERYLYNQLRTLSHGSFPFDSNESVELVHGSTQEELKRVLDEEQTEQLNREDLAAELELKRVLDGDTEGLGYRELEPIAIEAGDLVVEDQVEKKVELDGDRPSASSSRRSSVEVEAQRIVELPLKASDTIQSNQVEFDANELSRSIIVDALGNVTPPPDSRSKVVETETDQTVRRMSGSRRKSVVNIGDKLEVIYHKIGIEIEPAREEDEQEEETVEEKTRDISEAPLSSKQESESEASVLVSDERNKEKFDENETESRDDVGAEEEEETTRALHESRTDPGLNRLDRISSLPTSESEDARRRERRIASVDSSTSSERMKVFNGHDLDRMRRRTEMKRQPRTKEEEPPEVAREAKGEVREVEGKRKRRFERSTLPRGKFLVQVPVDEVKGRWREIKSSERLKAKDMTGHYREVGDEDDEDDDDDDDMLGRDIRRVSAKSQPDLSRQTRLEEFDDGKDEQRRSRPRSEYKNFVLIYEINTRDKRKSERFKDCNGNITREEYLLTQGESGELSKSEFKSRAKAKSKSKRDKVRKDLLLCQKKLVRIVDIRTLKRTISLPESLIYSNDLLKRFHILKI